MNFLLALPPRNQPRGPFLVGAPFTITYEEEGAIAIDIVIKMAEGHVLRDRGPAVNKQLDCTK